MALSLRSCRSDFTYYADENRMHTHALDDRIDFSRLAAGVNRPRRLLKRVDQDVAGTTSHQEIRSGRE